MTHNFAAGIPTRLTLASPRQHDKDPLTMKRDIYNVTAKLNREGLQGLRRIHAIITHLE